MGVLHLPLTILIVACAVISTVHANKESVRADRLTLKVTKINLKGCLFITLESKSKGH